MKPSVILSGHAALRRRVAPLLPLAVACLLSSGAASAQQVTFTPGNLVVAVEGCGVYGGTCTVPNGTGTGAGNSAAGGYGDNQASPLTLFQFSPVGTSSVAYVNSLVLPQTARGTSFPVSAEYGSSSEATLQLSGNGQYLTILGYGVNAADFDANPAQYGASPSLALGQSGSLTGQSTTAVPRVLALIDSRGNVSSSTALYNVFNTNNPRSAYSQDGTSVYISGQGVSGDTTQGVFYSRTGASNVAPVAISNVTDTRTVQFANNQLLVSVDSKQGSTHAIFALGPAGQAPTAAIAPDPLPGTADKITVTEANTNGVNSGRIGNQVNPSPFGFFFASPSVLYIADGGNPKSGGLGDGGLQKWMLVNGSWQLAYTLAKGLNLVANNTASGVTGLFGLTGQVVDGQAQLYATSATLGDLDTSYLYGISDDITATVASGASFNLLATAPKGSNFKGVSFAPNTAPATNLQVSAVWIPQNSGYGLSVNVFNAGTATVQDVTLTGISVGTFASTSLPVALGSIAAGNSTTFVVPVPTSVGSPTQGVVERITGTYTGGSFGTTQRAQLPQVQ